MLQIYMEIKVNTTMRLEGMSLTEHDQDIKCRCLEGETTFDIERKKIL